MCRERSEGILNLSSIVVSFTGIKKYYESLGTVRMGKCHGRNRFLSFFYSVHQIIVCMHT